MNGDPRTPSRGAAKSQQHHGQGRHLIRPLTRVVTLGGVALVGLIAFTAVAASRLVEALNSEILVFAGVAGVLLLAGGIGVAGVMLASLARRDDIVNDAFDALPSLHFVTDENGRLRYANANALALFGESQDPLDLVQDAIEGDDEDRQPFGRVVALAKVGRSGRIKLRAQFGGGPVAWWEVVATALPVAQGAVIWTMTDITTEEELRKVIESERTNLYDILDEAPVGVYSLDENGGLVLINQTLARWLGSTPEVLIGEGAHLKQFMAPEQPNGAIDLLSPLREVEISLKGRQGRVWELSLSQTVLEAGGIKRTRSVVRDLGPERARLEAGRMMRERFQRFYEHSPVGIALIGHDGVVTEANAACDALLEAPPNGVVGRSFTQFVTPEGHPELQARLAAAASGGGDLAPLILHVLAPGEKTIAMYVHRLETPDGNLGGLFLHLLDLTQQKSLEAQFAQSQKMQAVGQLAGGVAHDFNNLLTAMMGFCDFLLQRFRPGDQSFADIMQIKQNANRAARLVRQLLAFSRQQTLQPRVTNIGDVIAELSHLLNRLLGETVELNLVQGRELGLVKVDQGQLEQVIINLAVNARDAMPDGGMLTVRTSNFETAEPIRRELELMPPGSYVLIEVGDTGTGIPQDIMTRIFEPFFSTKDVGSGTGLGLSTVYGIVKQTGGFIFVDSVLGQGSTFQIYLPRHTLTGDEVVAPAVAELDEAPVIRDLTGDGLILLVEDEDPVRMFSARALRNKGYTVLEAKSGEHALQILNETRERIDLVIADVVMPRMDGPTLVKQLRERLPETKVIFMSGYTEDNFRRRLDSEGNIHFLAKPFSLKDLTVKVKEVMMGARA
jgi:two-component system cell cycle sensor histidine kinase/response regulator CckA